MCFLKNLCMCGLGLTLAFRSVQGQDKEQQGGSVKYLQSSLLEEPTRGAESLLVYIHL